MTDEKMAGARDRDPRKILPAIDPENNRPFSAESELPSGPFSEFQNEPIAADQEPSRRSRHAAALTSGAAGLESVADGAKSAMRERNPALVRNALGAFVAATMRFRQDPMVWIAPRGYYFHTKCGR